MENEQTSIPSWILEENEELDKQTSFDGEKLPALKFEENKVVKFTVDFSQPFNQYDDVENKSVKAIIPVTEGGEKKILWLNKKNPLYKEIIHAGKEGRTEFSVIQSGTKANTKYNLVKE